MSKTATLCIGLLCAILLCNACSWVNDDLSDCPSGCWVKLSYTYNMLDVDAAATQVKDATVFILDKDSNCIARQEVDSLALHQNGCMIKLPSLPSGEYTFLVWAGLADTNYQYSSSALALLRDEAGEQRSQLAALFHGRLDGAKVMSDEYTVFEIPLVKNTNTMSCILQSQSGARLAEDEFTLKMTSSNGLLDHQNYPCDSILTCYRPFYKESLAMDGLQVVHMGMNTLRMMAGGDTQLTLVHNPSGDQIFSIRLCQYLLLSQHAHASNMGAQEYLDRQDQYNLIFFLTPTQDPLKPYVCFTMQVNNWMIRMNEAGLED